MATGLTRVRLQDVRVDRGCSQALVLPARLPPKDTVRRHAAAAMLRSVLARLTGKAPDTVHLEESVDGKPRLVGGGIAFNMSHSLGYSLLALSLSGDIGCDIEDRFTDEDVSGLAPPVLHLSELEAMERLAPQERQDAFRRYWVRKEAVLKAAGSGFLRDPRQVVTGLQDRHPTWTAREGPHLVIHDQQIGPGCLAAVASMDDACSWHLLEG